PDCSLRDVPTRYGRASGRLQAESLWRRGLSQYGGIEAALRWRTGGDGHPAPRAGPFRDQPGRRRSQIEFARTATTANRRTNAPASPAGRCLFPYAISATATAKTADLRVLY